MRYLPALIYAVLAALSFYYQQIWALLPAIIIFGIFPILELILKPDSNFLADTGSKFYSFLLYLIVPVQYGILIWFL